MAATYVYKAEGERGKKGIFLTPLEDPRTTPVAILPDGRRIQGQYVNTNEGRHQYLFGTDILGQKGVKIEYNGKTIDLEDSNKSYEGSNPYDGWQYRNKGDLGSGGGGGGPSNLQPGQIGYGATPAYLGGEFPDPVFADFDPIKKTPFRYTDPLEFSKKYGEVSREEVRKNAELSKELGLDQLAGELEGLKNFVPAASALKRSELAIDNVFNQAQRTGQLNQVFPDLDERLGGMRSDLEAQGRRANTYASGRAPDEITDRGLELTLRSRAADQSNAAGFQGLAATRTSDLLSAETRLGLAQYGENLVGQNVGARNNLLNNEAALRLAPTSYSDAGQQVKVTPSVSPASLIQNNLGQLNQLTMLSASQAFAGEVGQQEFITTNEQNRRQFNASGNFEESKFNAGVSNEFALTKFSYDVGYAGALAGASQTNINTEVALKQQDQANKASAAAQSDAQTSNTIGSIASGIGTIGSAVASLTGVGSGYGGNDAIKVGGTGYQPGTSYGGAEGSIYVPSGSKVPDGYTGVQTTSNGGTIAVPEGGSGRKPSRPSGPSTGSGTSNEDFDNGGDSETGSSGGSDRPSSGGDDSGSDVGPPSDADLNDEDTPTGGPLEPGDSFAVNDRSARVSRANRSPDSTSPVFKGFTDATGVKVKQDEEAYIQQQGNEVLRDAGIHSVQSRNATVPIGVNNNGKPLYGDQAKMAVKDPRIGSDYVKGFYETMAPLGIFDGKDKSTLQNISDAAGSVAFIDKLNTLWQNGDSKGFINAIAQKFKNPIINAITDDPKSRAGLKGAFSAYNLYTNWDRMSAGQKGLGLASVGLNAYKFSTGQDLGKKVIVEATRDATGKIIKPGLNVTQALELFQAGYNVYSMVNNWDDLNTIQKLASATGNVATIAELGKQFNLLGSGVSGSAVNVTTAQLANAGYSAAPQYGVGALVGEAGSTAPAGYTTVTTLENGNPVIMPEASTFSSAIGTAAAVTSIAAGAQQVYKGWGTGGSKGAINGAVGGSAIAAGMYTLGATNPFLLGGIVAVSVLGDTIKTGKEENQVKRDAVRDVYKNAGLADDKFNVTLADGTKVNIGVDGKGGRHGITNPDLLSKEQKGYKDLSSYDVDYTNDLDFASSMGGVTLSRLLSGGTSTNVNQMGGQLGNAAIANIGFGKEMSAENFAKMAENQRAMFAQAGIKSKADAMQLLNLAFAEKRLSAADYTSGQQAVNMFFDKNGYETAQKLMAGRHRGTEVAAETPPGKPTVAINAKTGSKASVPTVSQSQATPLPGSGLPASYVTTKAPPASKPAPGSGLPSSYVTKGLTKEEIRARNAERYSSGASLNG